MLVKQKIMAVAVAAVLMVAGLVGAASAQTGEPAPEKTGTNPAVEAPADLPVDETILDLEGDFEDWEPTAEEALPPEAIAEINAETDALVEYLRDKGFEVSVETDDLGFTYVGAEDGSDELFEAMDEYYEQLWAEELASMSAEEKAEWNAELDAWIAELAAEGITVEKEEIAPGLYDIVWTEELEEALFDIESDEGGFEDWEPTPQELAEINVETDALVEYLRDKGFEVSVETDEFGFRYVDAGDGSDELFEAMDEYYEQLWNEELASMSDEDKAEWNAELDAFIAELAAEGITVEKEEIAPGLYDIVWTEELEVDLEDFEVPEEELADA